MNAVIYARYSSDNQREESIEGQLRECKEYADQHGLIIIEEYIDRALSAKTDDRPEFQRMLRDSAKRQFEVVLVWKLDRFARNRDDSAVNKIILKKNGVRLVSAKESISDGPEGIILESMLEGMAEYYSAELSEKVVRGMTENVIKGKYNGGCLPLGYRVDEDQFYQVDPLTAPIVLEIFTRYADGETAAAITDSLNKRGLRSSKGNPFKKNSLHVILKNRKYIGELISMGITNTDAIPAIVPQETFDKVQKRVERNKKAPAKAKAPEEYILTTKLFCGYCEAFMAGESGTSHTGKKYHYYKCSHAKRKMNDCKKKNVKKDWIERYMVLETRKRLLHDTVICEIADALVEYQKRENPALPILRKQLKEVEKRISNMLDAIEQGIINDLTKQRLDDLSQRKADLEISIAKEQIANVPLTREQIMHFFSRFKDGDVNDPDYRRFVVDVFVNAFYLFDDYGILLLNTKDGVKTYILDMIKGSGLIRVPHHDIRKKPCKHKRLRGFLYFTVFIETLI